ncbi:TetR/AcrR family transcriptional regulator [Halopelagius fulvigenes]|uniref:TetR/AcrR family transcriptional regulator n=1 Tax=Halopelagius fulvigenes TaxID=1198324 RepID=A0ABD5TZY2_9EURY
MKGASGTEQRIREAAFRALAEHGYADLTIVDIGDELGQNPSLIYHYFDSKDELLLSMLDVFVDLFVTGVDEEPVHDPEAELRQVVAQLLHPDPVRVQQVMESPPTDIETAMSRVFVELWGHAIWDDDFRAETTALEERVREAITAILRTGIERGEFRPVDPKLTADHLFFLLMQATHTRATTNWETATDRVEEIVDDIIDDIARDD